MQKSGLIRAFYIIFIEIFLHTEEQWNNFLNTKACINKISDFLFGKRLMRLIRDSLNIQFATVFVVCSF